MSATIKLSEIPEDKKDKIENDLKIQINKNNYKTKFKQAPKYIYSYNIDDDDNVYLPFSYGYNELHIDKINKKRYTKINHKSQFTVRDEQIKLINETIKCLNKTNSCIISAYTGFGKCLAKNTPILMYNGHIKYVQNIKKNDKIMGDDSTPRNVLSISTGKEMLYKITLENSEQFTVNQSHILSLEIDYRLYYMQWDNITENYFTFYFDKDTLSIKRIYSRKYNNIKKFINFKIQYDNIVNISVNTYIGLSRYIKMFLKMYKKPVFFDEQKTKHSPYKVGVCIGKTENDNLFMNLQNEKMKIPSKYLVNSMSVRYQFLAGLVDTLGCFENYSIIIKIKNKNLLNDIILLCNTLFIFTQCFSCIDNCFIIKLYGKNICKIPIKIPIDIHGEKSYTLKGFDPSTNFSFVVEKVGVGNYYGFEIDGNKLFMLGNCIVTHNTFCSLVLSSKIGLKTMIIVNKLVLMNQWQKSIEKMFPGVNVCKIKPGTKIIEKKYDFYIINAINIEKINRDNFIDIGLVIVDEAHLIMAETLSKSLLHICPRYLIGLTATPYRPDGLDDLLNIYFSENRIVRKLWREHTVFKINTNFKPEISYGSSGQINWGKLLDEISLNEKRNNMIVHIITKYKERNFLILTKRISQGEILYEKLLSKNENVDTLLGKKQDFDKECRILIGTCQKVGVGFDFPKIDTLIIAMDIEEYFIQYLGRCMRRKDVNPIIFDLVDDNKILHRHYKTREKIYKEHGGTIKIMNI
jgi:superfamily II DNA or RNA helicase